MIAPFKHFPTLIVPGWQDSNEAHWQSLWQKEFGWGRVVQDDWLIPVVADWSNRLSETVTQLAKPVVLVTHSLGGIALAHAFAQNHKLPVKAAFIVAPPDLDQDDTPNELRDFLPVPMKRFSFPSLLVASSNDPYCALNRAEGMAQAWGSSFVCVGKRHHIGDVANLGEWAEGKDLLSTFLRKVLP